MKITPLNFQGKYRLDINQPMPDANMCYKRDSRLDYWTQFAVNQSQINKDLLPILENCQVIHLKNKNRKKRIKDKSSDVRIGRKGRNNHVERNDKNIRVKIINKHVPRDKELFLIFDIPDYYDSQFEDSFRLVGQRFEKLG